MRAILDTNMLMTDSLAHLDYELAVSSISWAELGFGIRKAGDQIERARRERRILRLRTLFGDGIPFDDDAAKAYETVCGLVLSHVRSVRGRAIDLMIAATAVAHGAAVITRNADDFAGLEGLVTVVVG